MPQINYIPPPPGPPLPDDSEDLQLGSSGSKLGDETNPPTLAIAYLAAGSSIICTPLHVKYGKYEGEAAGLIVFETNFDFPARDSRTKCATIEVSFSLGDPKTPTPLLQIRSHYPKLVKSQTTTPVSICRAADAELKLNLPSPADEVGLKLGGSKEESFTRIYHSRITGTALPYSDTRKGSKCMNTVKWTISENEAQQSGVPPIFRSAIIIQLPDGDGFNGLFYAQFKLRSTQACKGRQLCKSFIQYFGRDKDGPVRFDSRINFKADGLSDNLEEIDLKQLVALPDFQNLPDGYY
jgi:hypothetical protein